MRHVITLSCLGVLTVLLGGCQPQSSSAGQSENTAASAAASPAATAGVLALTAADSGKSVTLPLGEALTVSLQGNASTGYSWLLAADGSPVLSQKGSPVVATTASDPVVVGAPEINTWTFTAQKAGDTTLRLEYRRAWEKDTAPAQTFEVKVSVVSK